MFSDPFAAVMALIILNFAGILLMFFFGLRALEGIQRTMREMKKQLAVDAADLDQRLREVEYTLRKTAPQRGDGNEDLGGLLEKAAVNGTLSAWTPPAPAAPGDVPESFATMAAKLPYAEHPAPAPLSSASSPETAAPAAGQGAKRNDEAPLPLEVEDPSDAGENSWSSDPPLRLK